MPQNVFYPGLNEFCRRYFVDEKPITPADQVNFILELQYQHSFLFEQLMLFDQMTFKVHGENVPLVFLLRLLGEKTFESLLEQKAFEFVLWTPHVGYLVNNIPGVDAITCGNLNSPAHSDPEKSIELGLEWFTRKLTTREKRRLVKKVLPLYKIPDPKLPELTVAAVRDALKQGRLLGYGLGPMSQLDNLSTGDKEKLIKCAADLLEYKFLIASDMTSFSEYKYFSPFWDTVERFKNSANIKSGFAKILEVERFPNLQTLSKEMDEPFARIATLRQKRSAKQMREWLEKTSEKNLDSDFVKEYINSIAGKKDFGSSNKGKITKSIIMTAIGTGVGAAADMAAGPTGLPVGSLTASGTVLGGAASFTIDLIDEFVIDRLRSGWTPRLFLDDISKMQRRGG